jgi:predicted alpha/beta-hydrolase family hydrolase
MLKTHHRLIIFNGKALREVIVLINGPEAAYRSIVLAHGAGVAMDSPFMEHIARGLAEKNFRVFRFEFPYMRRMRQTCVRRSPDTEKVLLDSWIKMIDEIGSAEELVIGGKSLGGRIASMIADEAGVKGLVCLGYPFHPPGKPERLRTGHLSHLKTPTLILQGARDAFGSQEEIARYTLSSAIQIYFLEDGDHSFKPRARSGFTEKHHLDTAVRAVSNFLESL